MNRIGRAEQFKNLSPGDQFFDGTGLWVVMDTPGTVCRAAHLETGERDLYWGDEQEELVYRTIIQFRPSFDLTYREETPEVGEWAMREKKGGLWIRVTPGGAVQSSGDQLVRLSDGDTDSLDEIDEEIVRVAISGWRLEKLD